MDSDSDKLFNKYIEIDHDEAMEKENQKSARSQPNAKKEQFTKIYAFHEEYKEQLKNKDLSEHMWDTLAIELNEMGPPVYSSSGWRKKWSEHKYNKKRKESTTEAPSQESSQDQSSQSLSIAPQIPISQNLEFVHKIGEVSAKQDFILQEIKQSNHLLEGISKQQNVIIQKFEKSNLLLEQIARK